MALPSAWEVSWRGTAVCVCVALLWAVAFCVALAW